MTEASDESRAGTATKTFYKVQESLSSSLRSLKLGKGQRIVYATFLTCVGLVIVSVYYGNAQVSLFSRKNVDERTVVLGLLFPSRSKSAIATSSFSAAGSKEEATTASTRKAIATFIENESEKAIASSTLTTTIATDTEPLSACGNSQRWLKGPRYGNLHDDPFLTNDLAQHMILNLQSILLKDSGMPAVLRQTICHADSRFLNSTQPAEASYDDRTVRIWAVKLIYLAVHYHQHRLAAPEAVARYSSDNSQCPSAVQLKQENGVGIFDYECPDAKYIVMPLCGNGLGANVRGGMVLALLMGLISDRIVIFVNNAEKGDNLYLKTDWSLASCPRKDYQCFFWATTPCTLTQDEIRDAYILTRPEYRRLMKRNKQPVSIEHHKVWTFNSQFMPLKGLPDLAADMLYQHALTLIAAVPEAENPEYVALLKKAAETIQVPDDPREGYNYAAATMKVHHALAFYAMRPNPRNAHELDRILTDIIPKNFQPENSVGLPIRASDKCSGESECLSFDQHMHVTSDMWQRHQRATGRKVDPTVVFTTEATSMVKEQLAFIAEKGEQKYPFKFDFVTNAQDVTPDSGFMKDVVWKSKGESDADEVMLSAVSSFKAQLLTRVSIGNCCSNFHAMLNDFLSEGCGAASDNTFLCLQEYEDPFLRVCCGWHHECKENKRQSILNMSLAAI